MSAWGCAARDRAQLLNVSFDPTRELFEAINPAFVALHPELHDLRIKQSHGGSAKQARSVIEGLDADVVTLALGYDIDALADAGVLDANWQSRLPDRSAPYRSTIVMVTRAGNPKGIRTFDDLAREGISVITPNPKTSGGARYNHLAVWGNALRNKGSEALAFELMVQFYSNVPVLDSGARGALTTFAERGLGDALVTWESDALLVAEKRPHDVTIVYPDRSILAEPPVAVVDSVVNLRGTRALATSYLEFLYSDQAQALIAKLRFRPTSAAHAASFHSIDLFDIESLGGWRKVHQEHFAEDGIFDRAFDVALAGKAR
jgi:sulfate/thiosulfate transport system substrate-binding protein